MAKHPTPDREGHWWAKLTRHDSPELLSTDWEVVQVFDSNDGGVLALVPGVDGAQPTDAFVWGPAVLMPEGLN